MKPGQVMMVLLLTEIYHEVMNWLQQKTLTKISVFLYTTSFNKTLKF